MTAARRRSAAEFDKEVSILTENWRTETHGLLLLLENAMFLVLMVVTSISELGRVAVRNAEERYFDGNILEGAARAESTGEAGSKAEPAKISEKCDCASGI
jgi:hypothetical protein